MAANMRRGIEKQPMVGYAMCRSGARKAIGPEGPMNEVGMRAERLLSQEAI